MERAGSSSTAIKAVQVAEATTSLDFITQHTESLTQLFDGLFSSRPALNEAVVLESSQTREESLSKDSQGPDPGLKTDEYFRGLLCADTKQEQCVIRTESAPALVKTGSARRSSQPELRTQSGGGYSTFTIPRLSSGPNLALPRSAPKVVRKGSQLLANSLVEKDHEELAKLLIEAEQRVQLRTEKCERITTQYRKASASIHSIRQEREAETLKGQASESRDEMEHAVFERNRKQRQLMHAMSLRQEPPARCSLGVEVLDVMRKYYYAQRQNKVMFKHESMMR